MEKSTKTVTDAKVVYRMLLGGQCYTNRHKKKNIILTILTINIFNEINNINEIKRF